MQNSNKAMGGYFELEIANGLDNPNRDGWLVNSGRSAFELILISMNPDRVYLPLYTCDVIEQPLKRLGIPYEFYRLSSSLEPLISTIDSNDALVYVNYFGLMGDVVNDLAKREFNLIVDNSQAWFDTPAHRTPTFYSPRKFVGVPDGGVARNIELPEGFNLETDHESISRCQHLLIRRELEPEDGYTAFRASEKTLDTRPLMWMSNLTKGLLQSIPWTKICSKRKQNFQVLHESLGASNQLGDLIDSATYSCPMVYPYFHQDGERLRKMLIERRIFVASYWPNVLDWVGCDDSLESRLTRLLVPLPIDQRYGLADMQRLIEYLEEDKM